MSATTFIYALCEPGTRTVRYIGKTNNLKRRLREHLCGSAKLNTHLGKWLRSLRVKGGVPSMVTLSEVPDEEGASEEIRYVAAARTSLGMDLVNGTDGGEGTSGPKSPEWCAALSAAMTPERCAAISAAKMGVPKSPETRAAMSAAKSGVSLSPEHCAAMSASKKGAKASPETRAAMSAARKGVPIGPMSPEHRAAVSAAKRGVPWSPARRAAYEARMLKQIS